MKRIFKAHFKFALFSDVETADIVVLVNFNNNCIVKMSFLTAIEPLEGMRVSHKRNYGDLNYSTEVNQNNVLFKTTESRLNVWEVAYDKY